MATKWKNSKWTGILIILLCAALGSSALCSAYPYLRGRARERMEEEKARYDESESAAAPETAEMFIADEEYYRYLLSSIYYLNYEMTPATDSFQYFTQNYNTDRLSAQASEEVRELARQLMKNMYDQYSMNVDMNNYAAYGIAVDNEFGMDSILRGAISGEDTDARSYYDSGLAISYDSRGIPSIRSSWNMAYEEAELLGYLRNASMNRLLIDNGLAEDEQDNNWNGEWEEEPEEEELPEAEETSEAEEVPEEVYEGTESAGDMEGDVLEVATSFVGDWEGSGKELLLNSPLPPIRNASFAFGVRNEGVSVNAPYEGYRIERAYLQSGYVVCVLLFALFMAVLALVLQNIRPLGLRERRIFRLPTEIDVFLWSWLAMFSGYLAFGSDIAVYTLGTGLTEEMVDIGMPSGKAAAGAATFFVWLLWAVMGFCWYWMVAELLPYLTHPLRTIRERAWSFDICRWLKKMWLKLWHWATDIELDEKLTRNIWKAVALNGVIVAALCCIWFGGVMGAFVYSILLYVLIKKKIAQIQGDYEKLLHVTRSLAEGDLNVSADEDMGLFNALRDEFGAIRNGFSKAVDDEVRSRNMKTELITNVSHDLKTPLTAIITYVDLLKKEDITEEERREYMDVLDRKSQRLKVLIEDLFEVSKASTDNLVMNYEDVDLVNLIKQVRLENEDKIQESTLDIRWKLPEVKCILSLDPNRTYRVIDNLVQNILKYSMPHSRVYIALTAEGDEAVVTMKNMSAEEMNFSPEEITERFVRGDLSRNTEGSGLGLAIAQSFTERQGGSFRVETDGDLFKVTLKWKFERRGN